MFFLMVIFRDEGHLPAIYLFYVIIIQRKCLAFQPLTRGNTMGLYTILTGVQNEHSISSVIF